VTEKNIKSPLSFSSRIKNPLKVPSRRGIRRRRKAEKKG